MIPFDKITQMMRELKTPYIRVFDSTKTAVIYTIEDGTDVEASCTKLESMKDILSSYGRVVIKAADAKKYAATYTGCFVWTVVFTNQNGQAILQQPAIGAVPAGYVPARVTELETELKLKTQSYEFEERMRKFEEKLNKKKGFNIEPWHIGIAGEALGWEEGKTLKYMQLVAMNNGDFNPSQLAGLSGAPKEKVTVSVEGTAQEKKAQVSDEQLSQQATHEYMAIMKKFSTAGSVSLLNKLNQLSDKVNPEIIINLIQGLIDKPEYASKALQFINLV